MFVIRMKAYDYDAPCRNITKASTTKYKGDTDCVSRNVLQEKIFEWFPYVSLCETKFAPGRGHFDTGCHNLKYFHLSPFWPCYIPNF